MQGVLRTSFIKLTPPKTEVGNSLTTLNNYSPVKTGSNVSCKLIDIQSSINIAAPKWIRHGLGYSTERLLGIQKINQLYQKMPMHLETIDFCHKSLEALNVSYSVTENELALIPQKGPMVMVANHPFGGLEGIILTEILLNIRPDIRILGNYLLNRVPELKEKIIAVDPFLPQKAAGRNAGAIRNSLKWLGRGGALLVFPAGEVSHFHAGSGRVVDSPWSPHIARLITLARAKTTPVYIHGRNSLLFNLAGMIHPRLRTILLPREMIRKSSETVEISIGRPIPWQRLSDLASDEQAISFLRFSTDILKHRTPTGTTSFFPIRRSFKNKTRQAPIVAPVHKTYLSAEIQKLPKINRLVAQKKFHVYLSTAEQSPSIIREIGRLREKSFRDVGEGTGQSIDLDEFDQYYQHIFLWNLETEEIIGAYRLGRTDQILRSIGARGLYSASLFDYNPIFIGNLGNALELGRSFIRTEYQRKFGCLAALWRGIGEFVVRNPQYRYLFGPVSISQDYQNISRNLIVEFLQHNKMNHELTPFVRPHAAPKINTSKIKCFAFEYTRHTNIEDISMLVSEIESDQKGVPTLIKHYLKLNGRFLAFNVDRDFSNVIDGLVWVDLCKADPKILSRFLGHSGWESFASHQKIIHSVNGNTDA